MDVNSYQYQARPAAAGISIFHDGLPKLASVHCYDRGNVASFDLDTYRPKLIKKKPLEKIISQQRIVPNPWRMAFDQQRLYEEQKRLFFNHNDILSNTLFKPAQQRFITQKPRLVPPPLYPNHLPRDIFRPIINKPYECTESCCVYTCCNQFITRDVAHHCLGFPRSPVPSDHPSQPGNYDMNIHPQFHQQRMYNQVRNQSMKNLHPDNMKSQSLGYGLINKTDPSAMQCHQYNRLEQNGPVNRYPQNKNITSRDRTNTSPKRVIDMIVISDDEKENSNNKDYNIDNNNNDIKHKERQYFDPGQQHEAIVDVETIDSNFKAFHEPESFCSVPNTKLQAKCVQKIIVGEPLQAGEIDASSLPIKKLFCSHKSDGVQINNNRNTVSEVNKDITENQAKNGFKTDLKNEHHRITESTIKIEQDQNYIHTREYIQNSGLSSSKLDIQNGVHTDELSYPNDCELEIDESSFDCFINNRKPDEDEELNRDTRKRRSSSSITPRVNEEEDENNTLKLSVNTMCTDKDSFINVKEYKYIKVNEG